MECLLLDIVETFKMELLPLEVVEKIAHSLSPVDLAACCATSITWREIFNSDILWRFHCDREKAEYLQITECVVKPGFQSPEIEGTGLSPISEWRLNYMRENHLWNNWRQGKYKWADFSRKLVFQMFDDDEDLSVTNPEPFSFYKNDFLFSIYEQKSVVWDLRGIVPIFYCENPITLMKGNKLEFWQSVRHEIVGNDLIVVNSTTVQVFEISLIRSVWRMKHYFLYDEENKCYTPPVNAPLSWDITEKYCFTLSGEYFVGMCSNKLHIWNWKTGVKVKKESCREDGWMLGDDLYGPGDKTSDKISVIAREDENLTEKVLIYSLSQLSFFDFSVVSANKISSCHIFGKFIAIKFKEYVNLYNYEEDVLIKQIKGVHFQPAGFKNSLILNQDGILKNLKANGEMITFLNIGLKVSKFETVADKFVSLSISREMKPGFKPFDLRKIVGKKEIVELWEIKEKPKKANFAALDSTCLNTIISLNRSCTKLVLGDKESEAYFVDDTVIHFW